MPNKNFKFIKKNANAKINFGLQILNKREDNYHNINTIFYPLRLHDKLEFYHNNEFIIQDNLSNKIKIEENLIYKVWKFFLNNFNISPIKVILSKNIPIGAGLGGGSSNAAKTAIAINEMFDLKLSYSELSDICSLVGSDVNYFLNGFLLAEGKNKGDKLDFFKIKERFRIILVNPGIHISTPWAYNQLKRMDENIKEVNFKEIILNENIDNFKYYIFNDFENIVFKYYPEIEELKNKLYQFGASFALMSGSGSTVFGIFNNNYDIKSISEHFGEYFVHLDF